MSKVRYVTTTQTTGAVTLRVIPRIPWPTDARTDGKDHSAETNVETE